MELERVTPMTGPEGGFRVTSRCYRSMVAAVRWQGRCWRRRSLRARVDTGREAVGPAAHPRTASPTSRATGASAAISRPTASRPASSIAMSTPGSAARRRRSGGRSSIRRTATFRINRGQRKKPQFHHAQHREPSKPEYFDPVSRCFQEGVPRINYQGNMRILQTAEDIVILHEFGHHYRVIYLDGRPPLGTRSSCGWATRAGAGKAIRSSSR